MYQDLEKSTAEIGRAYGVSGRTIQRLLKKHGAIRTQSESFVIAIRQGRMKYDHLRKEVHKKDYRKTINPKLRVLILARDKYTCQFCGGKAPEVVLQIDHKDADVSDNRPENLQTLCIDCNQGKKEMTMEELLCSSLI